MKRISSLFLCIAFVLTLFAALPVSADDWTVPDGFTQIGTSKTAWKFDSTTKTLTITGTGQVESFANADAQPWVNNRASIKNLVVKSGITGLTNYNFSKCDLSGTITLPDTLTYIGYCTFSDTKITNLDFIPDSVWNKTVTYNAWTMNCSSLTGTITLPANVKTISGQSFQNTKVSSIIVEGGADAPELNVYPKAFLYMPSLTSLKIMRPSVKFENKTGNSVTTLDGASSGTNGLFTTTGEYHKTTMSNLTIMCSQSAKTFLESLSDYATGSPKIYALPDDTVKCDAISAKHLVDGYWTYNGDTLDIYGEGEWTEEYYTNPHPWSELDYTTIKKVVFHNGITSVASNFGGRGGEKLTPAMSAIEEVVFPNTLATIKPFAFGACSKLKDISYFNAGETTTTAGLPEGIETIEKQAFQNCPLGPIKNNALIIPASVKSIGENAFVNGNSTSVNAIIFAKGSKLETIGKQAFAGRWSVNTVEIPATVTSIGENAFKASFDKLTVYFEGAKPTTIGANAFASEKKTGNPAVNVVCYRDGYDASDFGDLSYLTVTKADPVVSATLSLTEGNTDVTAKAAYRAPAAMAANQDYILIIAGYDASGTLVGANVDTFGIIEPDTTDIEREAISKTIEKINGATTYKAFLWDNFNSCTPITTNK